jgi:Flp pilus assembly protein TadD
MTSTRDEGSSDERSAKAEHSTIVSDVTGSSLLARWRNRILLAAIIVLAGLWVYSPSYHGEWLWDDDDLLVENPTVQHRVSLDPKVPTDSRATLVKLWLKPGTPDYFPLFYTALWAQWPFFGSDPTGYHVTSILLHIAGALLVWALLAKMRIPGAWLAGFVFAIHPVCVSSVAWVSELKNTLSLPLFLLACLCWVGHDDETDARKRQRLYAFSILFFLAAMLAKTSMVAFPLVVLLYAWWKHGKVDRDDVVQALPLFAISLTLGLITLSYQWGRGIGAEEIHLAGLFTVGGFLDRVAISGTAVLHYLATIVWPVGLLPNYPRWGVDPPALWMFLGWPVVLGALWWMWRNRAAAFPPNWGRHALFAFGFFLLMLAPVLGFVDIAYMRVTWVADHFVYVPMIGIVAFLCAGAAFLFHRLPEFAKIGCLSIGVLLLAMLAFLAFRYAHVWQNEDNLWEYTLRRDPDAWMAHNRLGAVKAGRGDFDGAHDHFLDAVRLRPDLPETLNNLGSSHLERSEIFRRRGDREAAGKELEAGTLRFQEACRLAPRQLICHLNLANALSTQGRYAEAEEKFLEIIGWNPGNPETLQSYGFSLYMSGRLDEAIEWFRRALDIAPNFKKASEGLALALAKKSGSPAVPQAESPPPAK